MSENMREWLASKRRAQPVRVGCFVDVYDLRDDQIAEKRTKVVAIETVTEDDMAGHVTKILITVEAGFRVAESCCCVVD